jgi:hypothetical protein
MFLAAPQPLQPLWKFLRPQHIGVNQFAAYPVAGKDFVHKPSMAHPPKIFNTAKCSLLFFWKKSKATIIGKLAFASLDIEEKCAQFESQSRGISMIPRQLKTCDIINSG